MGKTKSRGAAKSKKQTAKMTKRNVRAKKTNENRVSFARELISGMKN